MPGDGQAARTLEFVAYFTKGLGDVVAGELREILRPAGAGRDGRAGEPGECLAGQGERFVVVRTGLDGAGRVLARARTVDDFRLLVAGPCRVTSEEAFRSLCDLAARRTREFLAGDAARAQAPWSVTLSARRPAWAGPPAWSPDAVMAEAWPGADVTARARAPVDLRVQVDGDVLHVAASLGGKRADPVARRPGALRPAVAAAMVRMAVGARQPGSPDGLYDPFTGTGTIAAEAWRMGLPVFASDTDPEAVRMTRERLARLIAGGGQRDFAGGASLMHRIFVHDVRDGVPRRVRAGLLVGNMPWGKQVQVPRRAELFDATAGLARHVLAAGGVAVLLTTHEEQFTSRLRRLLPGSQITAHRIGLLGQTPAIVVVLPDNAPPGLRPLSQ